MAKPKLKVVIVRKDLKPIFVAQVIELGTDEVFRLSKEAQGNLLAIEGEYCHVINKLVDRVEKLEKEVKHLKGED